MNVKVTMFGEFMNKGWTKNSINGEVEKVRNIRQCDE